MLKSQLQTDFITAMKARDTEKLDTLKMIRAAIKNQEIDLHHDLSDEEVISVLRSEAKKRTEAIELYKQGKRQDLVDKESAEFALIQAYLPAQMSKEDIEKEVDKILLEVGSGVDFGKVMGQAMGRLKGKADGKLVGEVVKNKMQI